MHNKNIQLVELEWAYRLINSGPVLLVTTTDGARANVCTVAWSMPLSKKPPRFGLVLGHSHLSFANVQANPIIGINIPTVELRDLVMYCGSVSGRDVDKIERAQLTLRSGSAIPSLPLLDACAAWLECRVQNTDAGAGEVLVIEAVGAACRPGVLDQDHQWDVERHATLHHLGGSAFAVAGHRQLGHKQNIIAL